MLQSHASSKSSEELPFFSLAYIDHTLSGGECIYVCDQGGSGGDGAIGDYSLARDGVQVSYRHKYGPEFAPTDILANLSFLTQAAPSRIVYGVAAPVKDNACPAGANMPYAVSAAELRQVFSGADQLVVDVLNDFALLLHRFRVPVAPESRITLQEGKPSAGPSIISVNGAGSGLGVGQLLPIPGVGHFLQPLEGSHGRVAIRYDSNPGSQAWNRVQSGLVRWWTENYGPLNWDKVLCASGLVKLVRYLVLEHGYALPDSLSHLLDRSRDNDPFARATDPKLVGESALDGSHLACRHALELFMDLYGGFCQTAAYLHAERGQGYQMYLAGGVLAGLLTNPAFLPTFGKRFLESFRDTVEPADKDWLANVPIHCLLDPRTDALYGAVIAAACMEV